jgi:hypothetical protein
MLCRGRKKLDEMGEALVVHRTIGDHLLAQVAARIIDLTVDEEVGIPALQVPDDRIEVLLVGPLGKTVKLAPECGELLFQVLQFGAG